MVLGRARKRYSGGANVDWLIVGLGNPGAEYEGSPHNAGFEVVKLLADEARVRPISKFQGLWGTGELDEVAIALLMPLTYMNLSGQSVKPAMRQLGLTPEQIVIVHDEVDLEFGRIQVKHGGGLAGHNGLKSITESIGTKDYTRVRVGVGRPDPGDRRPLADWLLKPMPADRDAEGLYRDGAYAVRVILRDGVRAALSRIK
jgi:peptidyl-tRNA hydrolase, PTH1 family